MEAIKAILRKVLYWGRYLCTVKRRYNEPPGGGGHLGIFGVGMCRPGLQIGTPF